MFYPDNPAELCATVRGFLDDVPASSPALAVPKAIVAPHAGYVYSGAVAALAYARLRPAHDRIKRVVLLGPCHRVAVRGLAVSSAAAFATPLGDVRVDRAAIDQILPLPQVSTFDETHRDEHSLEVHLPFLQEVLDDFCVVPLVVGDATNDEVAEVLDTLWGGPETLIVISTDLSHFRDYGAAQTIDRATCDAIERFDPDAISHEHACGRIPLKGLLVTAQRRAMRVETLDLCNSGDTAGSHDRVVGYGAWAFEEPAP